MTSRNAPGSATITADMKIAAAAAVLLLTSCNSVDTTKTPETLKHRIIAEGGYGQLRSARRQASYAATDAAYRSLWRSLVGQGDPPPVDFTREGVLFIAAGERPTGGYAVDVKAIRREGDAIVVDAPVTSPPPDAMVTQALTSPFVVVAVPKVESTDVRWVNP
jgi:hypothetical protein